MQQQETTQKNQEDQKGHIQGPGIPLIHSSTWWLRAARHWFSALQVSTWESFPGQITCVQASFEEWAQVPCRVWEKKAFQARGDQHGLRVATVSVSR